MSYEIKSITVFPNRIPIETLITHRSEAAPLGFAGVPVYTSVAVPDGYCVAQMVCRCTVGVVEADGGELMHAAKRHTRILKL